MDGYPIWICENNLSGYIIPVRRHTSHTDGYIITLIISGPCRRKYVAIVFGYTRYLIITLLSPIIGSGAPASDAVLELRRTKRLLDRNDMA